MLSRNYGLEAFNNGKQSMLGVKFEFYVEQLLDMVPKRDETGIKEVLSNMQKVVKDETGMKIVFGIDTRKIDTNMTAGNTGIDGHSSYGYWPDSKFDRDISQTTTKGGPLAEKVMDLEIDLERGFVSGSLADINDSYIIANVGNFLPDMVPDSLTMREIVATYFHEIGHCWQFYQCLGEYTFIDYLLTEGVEVMLGKKPNRYKIEIYSPEMLAKLVQDPELAKELRTQPNKENLRRAILTSYNLIPRHYLSTRATGQSLKRSEQQADYYAVKLGNGKDFATGLNKTVKAYGMDRVYNTESAGKASMIAALLNVVGISTGVLLTPITAPMILLLGAISMNYFYVSYANAKETPSLYDPAIERFVNIKRAIQAQFQTATEPEDKEKLRRDIEAMDLIINSYQKLPAFWNTVANFVSVQNRQLKHTREHEQALKDLMYNPLYLKAFDLQQFA